MTTTPTLREAAQQALEALESLQGGCTDSGDGTTEAITVWCPEVITALRAALAEQAAEQAVIPPAFAHAASQQMAVTSEWCRGWDACRAHILSAAPAAEQAGAIPAGWVPLRMEWEPGYPEDVAFGPPRMMERLKKWLDKHFAARVAEANAEQAEPVASEWELLGDDGGHTKWVTVRNRKTQCAQDIYESDDPLMFGFLTAMLADAPPAPARQEPLTEEQAKAAFEQWAAGQEWLGDDEGRINLRYLGLHRQYVDMSIEHASRAFKAGLRTAAPAEGGAE